MPKKFLSLLLIALFMAVAPVGLFAQFGSPGTNAPIWGTPITADPIWGSSEARPSSMTNDPIWNPIRNNPSTPNRNSNQSSQQQNSSNNIWNRQQQQQAQNSSSVLRQQEHTDGSIRSLNISSRIDTLGNLVQDTTFVQIGDSSVAVSGSINDDMDNILPPPDDPVDAPIDNGVALLIAIGLVSGYSQFRQKKKVLVKA